MLSVQLYLEEFPCTRFQMMLAVSWLYVFPLFFTIATSEIVVNGTINVQTPLSSYQAGDSLLYEFYCELVITSNSPAYNLNISFSYEWLQFPSNPTGDQYAWTYYAADNPTVGETSSTLDPADYAEGVGTESMWFVLTGPINANGKNYITGTFQLDIPASIMPSDKLSADMTVEYNDQPSGGASYSSFYSSDNVYIESPYFAMSSPAFDVNSGITMGIGDSVDVTVTMALPRATVEPVVEVSMPYNLGAIMTVPEDVTTSFGTNVPGAVTLNNRESTSANLEYDRVDVNLNEFTVTTGDITEANNEMQLDFDVRLDDHDDVSNHSESWLMVGVMYGRTHIWVGQMAVVALVDEADRSPKLQMQTNLSSHVSGQDIYQGDDVTVSVDIWHCGQRLTDSCDGQPSRGVAQNVQVVLILPPFSTFHDIIDWQNLDNAPIVDNVHQTLIKIQLGDLSFSYKPHIRFNITVDPDGMASSLLDSVFVGLIEVLYFSKQGELKTHDLTSIHFDFIETMATTPTGTYAGNLKHLKQSETCTCPHNTGKSDCACCVDGASRCDNIYHEICVETKDLSTKCPSTDFYDSGFVVNGDEPAVYVCDSSEERLAEGTEFCSKGDLTVTGQWSGCRKDAVNILGVGVDTNALYGIHKNTRAYLTSEDGGLTWLTIPQQQYENAKVDPQFVSFERSASGGSLSHSGWTVSGTVTTISYQGDSRLVFTCPSCPQ